MSFIRDEAHPWRSAALAKIPVRTIKIVAPSRGRVDLPCAEPDDNATGLSLWLEHERVYLVPSELVTSAAARGSIRSVAEIATADGQVGIDGAIVTPADLDYDLQAKDTQAALTTEGAHFSVRPLIDSARLDAMTSANTVESFAKAIDMKLPRIVTQSAATQPNLPTYNQFESLRWEVAREAGQADYGVRLHSLARIVCHATVLRAIGASPGLTPMMARGQMLACLTAETPSLLLGDFRNRCWIYLCDELDPRYRAFLVMGVRGLQHYAGAQQTVYSRLLSEPEAGEEVINFVRRAGDLPIVVPPPAAYTEVLRSADLAMGYYFAYANSLGIGHKATQVLLQTMLGPHIWGEHATLPYKAAFPRLDAATYLLRTRLGAENVAVPHGFDRLVSSAPLIARRFMASLGALLGDTYGGKRISIADVMAQVVGVMSSSDQARELLKQVWACTSGGYAALEWITPFQPNVPDGFERAVSAYRSSGHLIAQCRRTPCGLLTPVFTTGVPMRDAVLGVNLGPSAPRHNELVIYQLAAGVPLKCRCEADYAGMYGPRIADLGIIRSWKAVVQWVRYDNLPIDTKPRRRTISQASLHSEELAPAMGFAHFLPETRTLSTRLEQVSARPASTDGTIRGTPRAASTVREQARLASPSGRVSAGPASSRDEGVGPPAVAGPLPHRGASPATVTTKAPDPRGKGAVRIAPSEKDQLSVRGVQP